MEKWELAVNKFLEKHINEDYFLGAMLCGSYATGNNTKNSDIDIFIVTKDETKWRERGNIQIDGYLIEYFINPVRQVLKEFDEGFKTNSIATTRIFAGAKILHDTDKIIEKLINQAKQDLNKKIDKISEFEWKMNCYTIWHTFYELTTKYENNEDTEYTYNLYINEVIKAHFKNNSIPTLPTHKIEKMFTNEQYRIRYNVKYLPEQEFIDKVLNCLNEKEYNKKYEYAKDLYNYYMNQNKDFDINNFTLRSEV